MKRVKADKILSEMPMAFRAEEALKKAVAKAIADHKRTGDPIVVWRDGKVTRIPAHEIEIREPATEYILSDREDE